VEELAPPSPLCAIPIVFSVVKKPWDKPNDERNSNHQELKENFAQSAPRVEELAPPSPLCAIPTVFFVVKKALG